MKHTERLLLVVTMTCKGRATRRMLIVGGVMVAGGIVWLILDPSGGRLWRVFVAVAVIMLLIPFKAVDRLLWRRDSTTR